MIEASISVHAYERGKERLGLNRKAMDRTAAKALNEGKRRRDFSGSFRRYLDKLFHSAATGTDLRVYGHHIYVFSWERDNVSTLITILEVPTEYKKAACR